MDTKKPAALFLFIFLLSAAGLCASQENTNISLKKQGGENNIYWHGSADEKKIALTFDDGPNKPYTSEILDILKRDNVKATFFLIGENVERYPEVARRIANEGHAIGNHTYRHPDLLAKGGIFKMGREIDKTDRAILGATGVKVRLLRPPYGSGGNIEAQKRGLYIIKWSVSGGNGGKEIAADKIVKNVVENTENGSIILLHDGKKLEIGADRSQVVKALPDIISILKHQGYEFVTVPRLLGIEK